MPNNMAIIFEGTSAPNLRQGPVTDILTTLTITNDKIRIGLVLPRITINMGYSDLWHSTS